MNNPFRYMMAALPMLMIVVAATLIASANSFKNNPSPQVNPFPWVGCDSLDVTVDGATIHLLVGSNTKQGETASAVFKHVKSSDGGATWSVPTAVSVNSRQPVPHHRGADARIIARGDQLFAAWTTPGTGFKGTGPMGTAISSDGGLTWKAGPDPSDLMSTGSHRFLALAADRDAFHLIWLDDREKQRGLRHARSTDGGKTWSANATIDDLTCACCWNMLAVVPASPVQTITAESTQEHETIYALYRDMNPSDMGLASSTDGGKTWRKQGHIGEFDWQFKGCPHVGGGLVHVDSPQGERNLFATVWSGKPGHIGVHLFTSDAQGQTWLPLRKVGDDTASHPTIAAQGSAICVAWDDLVDGDRAAFAMTSSDGGKTWNDPQRLSATGMQGTHPRVIGNPAGSGFITFWTQSTGNEPPVLQMKVLSNAQ